MIKSEDRPKGMSQVDWLWLNYKHFNVQNEASEIPSDRILLTEQAISNMIRKATGGGITKLRFEENPDDPSTMRLMGHAVNGELLSFVILPKEEHIVSFTNRKVTQIDIDNGCSYEAGTDVLAIATNLDNVHLVSLKELNLQLSGTDTDTVFTEVIKGVVSANVKIDSNNNALSPVEIKKTNNGLYTKLKLDDSSTGVKLEISDKGLKAYLPMETGSPLRFKQLTLDEYLMIEPVDNTIYFITDKPFVYLNKMRYGVDMLPGDYPIVSLVYDDESMRIYYKKADESDIQTLDIGAVSAEKNGMMTKNQFTDFQRLLKAIGDITDVAKHTESAVKAAAFSLEKGQAVNGQYPIMLKNGVGNILSTIYVAREDYLTFAEQRGATQEDVIAAAAKGMLVKEGEALLVLTLTSGDKVYVSLSQVADIYEGETTETVQVSVGNYKISAAVLIPADEKVLFKSVNGLSTRLSIKQTKNVVQVFGKTETDQDKIGEFIISDQLLSYRVLRGLNENMIAEFPPAQVDGLDYDPVENPLHLGHTYLVLTMGVHTGDSATDYRYNLYLYISGFMDELALSNSEDNILTKGTDGHLFAAVPWNEVN